MRAAALALLLLACAPPPPRVAPAVALVWDMTYHRTEVPPELAWVPTAALNCGAGHGFIAHQPPPLMDVCAIGAFYQDLWAFLLAEEPAGAFWDTTAMPHELCHARHWLLTGDSDYYHLDPCFGPGGEVEAATKLLQDLGLTIEEEDRK